MKTLMDELKMMNTMDNHTTCKITLKQLLELVDLEFTTIFITVVSEDHNTVVSYSMIKIGCESDIPSEWLNYEVCRIFGSSFERVVSIDIVYKEIEAFKEHE